MEIVQLEKFFSGLEATLASARKFQEANNREYAFEFNPLIHFYGVGENKLSDMLAFFLNPKERHGQGDVFLKSFLEQFGLKERIGDFSSVRISREKQTVGMRRLDLLFEFSNGFGLGIENKIWAADQAAQISDYCSWMEEKFPTRFALIYLKPYRERPSEGSIEKTDCDTRLANGTLLLRDHSSDTTELIGRWAQDARADRVRHFLQDFEQFIHHEVNGDVFMSDKNTAVNFILEDSSKLKAAIVAHEAMNDVLFSIWKSLEEKLKPTSAKHGLESPKLFRFPRDKWCGFRFEIKNPLLPKLTIGFEWEGRWLADGYVGFIGEKEFREPLRLALGEAHASDSWPWWKELKGMTSRYATFDHQGYVDIFEGEGFVEFVDNTLTELLTSLKKISSWPGVGV